MKILFIGNFEVDYSSENHYKKTLEKLGHQVVTAQENKTGLMEVYKKLIGCHMVLHVHTHGPDWQIQGIDQFYKDCRLNGIPTVGYHLDLFKGIRREINLDTDPYWSIEYFFTADKNFVPDLEAKGIKAYYLPAGVLEDECYLAEPNRGKYPHDVIFVGSRGYHPEWPYRRVLIDWLTATYGNKFGHYGGDGLGVVRGHDLNVLYASAKVVIGDTLCKNFNYPHYFSDRLFETTGRGGFLVFPYIEGLETMFNLDLGSIKKYGDIVLDFPQTVWPEIIDYTFDDFDELKFVIDFYCDHRDIRERIRRAGFERTRTEHTYTQRLKFLLDTVFNGKK